MVAGNGDGLQRERGCEGFKSGRDRAACVLVVSHAPRPSHPLTADFEADATGPLNQQQGRVRQPGALKGRHDEDVGGRDAERGRALGDWHGGE